MPIEDANRQQYRRGLALGFTLAELFTILLFLLLLIFAAVRQSEIAHARELESKNQKLAEELQRAKQQAQALVERNDSADLVAGSTDQIDDMFRDLVLSQKDNEQLRKQISALSEKAKDDEKFRQSMRSNSLSAREPGEIVRDAKGAEDARRILERPGLVAQNKGSPSPDLTKTIKDLVDSQGRLQGQVANLTHRCGGGGTEMPPCWVTPSGEIEFFADVELASARSGGTIVIHDDDVPGHEGEKKVLFRDLKFDQPSSESDFLDETQDLYDFGERQKPQCRFFVRVIDHTGPQDKEIFKSLLQTVEEHFYKKLIQQN
jgi:hypothetical protein